MITIEWLKKLLPGREAHQATKPQRLPLLLTAEFMFSTQENLAAAFTEWERRFRQDPQGYVPPPTISAGVVTETYGEAAAKCLLAILHELRGQ